MLKALRSFDYPTELIETLLKAKMGTLGSNFLGPLLLVFLFKDIIPPVVNITFILAQTSIFIVRIIIANKTLHILDNGDKQTIQKYVKYYLSTIFANAFLLGLYSIFTLQYSDESHVLLYIAIILTLNAGAVSTLSSIFHAFFIFSATSLGILLVSLFLVKSNLHYSFIGVLIFLFILITISAGFKIHKTLYTGIKQTEEIKKLNLSLEEKIQIRTKELAQKTEQLEMLNKSLDKRIKEEIAKSRKNEQLLIQQSRQAAMGEMIGNIAHQWRQPLNALGLVLQNIHFSYQMDELDDKFMQKSIDKGKMLTTSMSKTIDDFRDFFKPNKIKERFMISDIVHTTIELVDASFRNHNIVLKTELDDTLALEGYPSEFSQVVLNILSNAKDALLQRDPPQKRVMIKSYRKEDEMLLEISDNAGGIPEGVIGRIFDPYFTTKEEGKGTGIGLYMSKTIVEQNMNGRLLVRNCEEGAHFIIAFALHQKRTDADIENNPTSKVTI